MDLVIRKDFNPLYKPCDDHMLCLNGSFVHNSLPKREIHLSGFELLSECFSLPPGVAGYPVPARLGRFLKCAKNG